MSSGGGSREIDAALAAHSLPNEHGYDRASLKPCVGARFHSPNPLITQRWSPEVDAYLCGTCADNLTVFLMLHEALGGKMPWTLLREFGNQLRALARTVIELEASQGSPDA